MAITYHRSVIQGSDEWLAMRCGILTASEMDLIITPTLKVASNGKERAHLYELAAQRITRYVEPTFISDDMLRGMADESQAKMVYAETRGPVADCGFITNNDRGFTLGYSPDGLVGDYGLVEVKSRRQKYQAETIITGAVPVEYMIQIQTGLIVSERMWCDFVSYCGGMPLFVRRVYPDDEMQTAIIAAAEAFEDRLQAAIVKFRSEVAAHKMPQTRRIIAQEMHL